MKIDQSGGKGDYDLKQQQQQQQHAMRSSADVQQRNTSSVLQNIHGESNIPRSTGQSQAPKPAAAAVAAKRSPIDEPPQRQNGTNGKANVSCSTHSLCPSYNK